MITQIRFDVNAKPDTITKSKKQKEDEDEDLGYID